MGGVRSLTLVEQMRAEDLDRAGKSARQIASALGAPEIAVKMHLAGARARKAQAGRAS